MRFTQNKMARTRMAKLATLAMMSKVRMTARARSFRNDPVLIKKPMRAAKRKSIVSAKGKDVSRTMEWASNRGDRMKGRREEVRRQLQVTKGKVERQLLVAGDVLERNFMLNCSGRLEKNDDASMKSDSLRLR